MSNLTAELRDIYAVLQTFADTFFSSDLPSVLSTLEECANNVGKAWSHSWYGFHSKVYYADFKSPPPGAHFSSEWGFIEFRGGTGTRGDWQEFDFDRVKEEIFNRANNPELQGAHEVDAAGRKLFEEKHGESISILVTLSSQRNDQFVEKLLEDAQNTHVLTAAEYVSNLQPPSTLISRDSLALTQGIWIPPHITVLAEVAALQSSVFACRNLADIVHKAATHIERVQRENRSANRIGTSVFLGHGRSPLWKDLKDFVQDRLRLPWDEFNRVPVAGITNIARLSEMLDAAAVAFVIMTAEDEQTDGKTRARMNVIHEVGLFQGRLGFTKAIVLLEEGCEEFSNIQGLGQIRFPKGNIKAIFEEIRQVLEREGVVASSG